MDAAVLAFPLAAESDYAESLVASACVSAHFDRCVGIFLVRAGFCFSRKGYACSIDPPKVLVVQGLYKYTRNPMYVSVLTVLAGECVLFHSAIFLEYVVLVALGFHVWVMLYEEPALTRKMGDAYEQYRDEVPRWVPRFWRRRANRAL